LCCQIIRINFYIRRLKQKHRRKKNTGGAKHDVVCDLIQENAVESLITSACVQYLQNRTNITSIFHQIQNVMDTLDYSPKPSVAPIWNTVLINGAYCGGAFVAVSLLMYLLNANLMSMGGIIILYGSIFVVGAIFAVIAIRHQRDQLDGGYISFGKALLVVWFTVFIGMLISGLWNFVLINYIDPNYIVTLKEQFMETWGQNMPEDALEEALEGFEKSGELLSTLKSSLFGGLFFGLIIGLITAAIMKKQPNVTMH
jgi:hypothetical protein